MKWDTFTIELTMTRLAEVDQYARQSGLTRSEAITALVNEGLSGGAPPLVGVGWASAEHYPPGSITCEECGKPALADGSTLGTSPICGQCLDEYYADQEATW